jgi:diguanylate cyclase
LKTQQSINVKTIRKRLVIALIVSIVLADSLVLLAPHERRLVIGDIINPISILIAAALSLLVVYRQKTDGLIGKAYAFLAAGLTLWCIAEILWSFTELVLGQKRPFPSISDGLWLIAYGPLIYYAFKMYNAFHNNSSRFSITLVSIGVAAYLLYIIPLTASTYELSKQEDIFLFLISISYSILDMVFIFPASLIILNAVRGARGGELTSIPWIFLSMVVIAVADSVFGYTSVAGLDSLEWTSPPIYSAGYLLMAVGLFWHNRFFIFDEKRVVENWQKDNR